MNNDQTMKDEWVKAVMLHIPNLIEATKYKEYLNCDNQWVFRIHFEHDSILWVSHQLVWSVLSNEYGMPYTEIQKYLKEKFSEHLNWYFKDIHCFLAPEFNSKLL